MTDNNKKPRQNKTISRIESIYLIVQNEANDCLGKLKQEDTEKHNSEYWPNIVFIERDIHQQKVTFDHLVTFFKSIRKEIGIKQFNSDNKEFINQILKTQKDLNYLKSKLLT